MAIGHSHIRPAMTRRPTPRAGLALRQALASPGGLALATSAYIAAALLVDRGADPVDVAGALCMSLLAVLILRSRAPTLYACMFACVALLELYGTAVGTWRWAELGPNFALPAGNPPSGIAAGYCLFDALALRLGPRLLVLWRARSGRLAPEPG